MRNTAQLVVLAVFVFIVSCTPEKNKIPEMKIQKQEIQFSLQAQGELEALKSTPIIATAKTQKPQTLAWIIEQYSYVKKGDLIAQFDGVPFQLEVDAAQYEINKLLFSRAQKEREMDLSIEDFNNEETVVNFEYLMAQKFNINNPMLYTKIEMIEAADNVDFLQAKTQHLNKMEKHYKDKSKSEVGLINSQSQLQQSKMAMNQSNLNQLEIRAPHAGIVVLKASWDGSLPIAGKSVFPGMKIASLPDLSQMKAKIYLPEIEAVGLKKGQKVEIRLHAFPQQLFTGTLSQISKTAQPKKRDNPVKYFIVSVLIDQQDSSRLMPGQRLQATLFTSDKQMAIAVPIQTIFREGQQSWVYLKTSDGKYVKKDVRTGECSSSQCIVQTGLQEGDVIALTQPQTKTKES